MSFRFETWPFSSSLSWTHDEEERWWTDCYLPHSAEQAIHDSPQWLILQGGYECGKSTALAALRKARNHNALVLKKNYAKNNQTIEPETSILYWIMHSASWDIREHLSRQPELIPLLSRTQLEFLRWAIEKFHQTRAFTRWLDGLPPEVLEELQEIPYIDLYPTQTITYDVQGQIEELVNLCTRIGFQQVLVTVDLQPNPDPMIVKEVDNFLGWLEPMQHPQLQMVLALPPNLCTPERLRLPRDRAKIIDISPSEIHTMALVERYLNVATNGNIQQLEQLCNKELQKKLNEIIVQEFDFPSPGAWIKVTKILLEKAGDWVKKKKNLPLEESCYSEVVREYYKLHMPIKKGDNDTHLGVWRGYKWIKLDRSCYEFLILLFSSKGRHVDHQQVRTTKSNLNTLARRLRVAIEPDPSNPIYLHNDRGEGYWFENYN